ncbi:MAG TPA: hypothetical protein VN626_07390, partial [Clostridia bacterium]|nr:hypothetical protein [Clostridia bacterium]
MSKKIVAILCALGLVALLIVGCSSGVPSSGSQEAQPQSSSGASTGNIKIALITMDSIDQHWVTLNEGAQKAASELGVTVQFLSPNTKDDAQQIEC